MLKISAQKPAERAGRIAEIRNNELAVEKSARVQSWGLDVSPTPMEVTGRVLAPPKVEYGQGRVPAPINGSWNLKAVKFASCPYQLVTWSVVNFTRAPVHVVQAFVKAFVGYMRELGMGVSQRTPDPRDTELVADIWNTCLVDSRRSATNPAR